MKREQFAAFILEHAKARFAAENERASGERSAIAPLDPQVEEIKAFLKTNPFGCHSEKARQFAEVVSGKKIPSEPAGPSKYCQRLRVRVIKADSNSHALPIGSIVLSLDRKGHCVTMRDGELVDHCPKVLKLDVQRATAEQATQLFTDLAAHLEELGDVLMQFELEELCELVK